MNIQEKSTAVNDSVAIMDASVKAAAEKYSMNANEIFTLRAAIKARARAYAPYSKFKVGAAILTKNGEMYAGCNVESSVYTLTTHAEGLAIDNMILGGGSDPEIIVIVMESAVGEAMPCGICRQKLSEFASADLTILGVRLEKGAIASVYRTTLGETLPHRFGVEIESRG